MFSTQSGNVPVSQLDQNFTDAFLGINNAFLSGTYGSIPAPDGIGKGRYYYATDTQIFYRDNGSAWVQIAASPTLISGIPIATATGTADAITATYSPALTLSNNVSCLLVAASANTISAPTFSPNGLTAHAITKRGGAVLGANDLLPNGVYLLVYNLANTRWELANPAGGPYGKTPVRTLKLGSVGQAQNTTRYAQGLGMAPTNAEANGQLVVGERCTVANLRVALSGNVGGAGQTAVFTVRKNGVATAVTCTINTGAAAGSDLVNSVTFEQGELLSVQQVNSATSGTTNAGIALTMTALAGDNVGAGVPAVWYFGSGNANFFGEFASDATETNAQVPLSACRVFTRGIASTGAVAATTQTLDVRRNGAVVVSGPRLIGDATTMAGPMGVEGLPVAFADNDLLSLQFTGTGAVNVAGFHRLAATTVSTYAPCPMLFTLSGQTQNTTRYAGGYVTTGLTATEANVQVAMPACVLRNLRGCISAAPAGGQTYTITVRKNGVDTALTIQFTSAGATTMSDTADSVTFAAGDILTIKSVSSATAGTRSVGLSLEATTT